MAGDAGGTSPSRPMRVVKLLRAVVTERQEVEIFRKQVGDDLYKVWPMETLPPGEYAWIQFTEGKANTQAWDFAIVRGK